MGKAKGVGLLIVPQVSLVEQPVSAIRTHAEKLSRRLTTLVVILNGTAALLPCAGVRGTRRNTTMTAVVTTQGANTKDVTNIGAV